jgi:hypothetical protein
LLSSGLAVIGLLGIFRRRTLAMAPIRKR